MGNEPKMLYYNAAGDQVADPNDSSVVVQYLSDDPLRPDANKKPAAPPATEEAPAEAKAQSQPPADKARKSSANK